LVLKYTRLCGFISLTHFLIFVVFNRSFQTSVVPPLGGAVMEVQGGQQAAAWEVGTRLSIKTTTCSHHPHRNNSGALPQFTPL
jgi:hypothetical protein